MIEPTLNELDMKMREGNFDIRNVLIHSGKSTSRWKTEARVNLADPSDSPPEIV